jgi:hypothetical protein
MEPYVDSVEHLMAEMGRLDLLLKRELVIARESTPQDQPDDMRGLVITENEIEALAVQPDYLRERWRQQERLAPALAQFDEREKTIRSEIDQRAALSRGAGIPLALPFVAQQFRLLPLEIDLLLVAIAPEIETRYETLYAYLQNDVTRKRPSADLALNLVSRTLRDKLVNRRLLGESSTLVAERLILLGEEPHDRQPSFFRKYLKPHDGVVGALLGRGPEHLAGGVLRSPRHPEAALDVAEATRMQLERLVMELHAGTQGATIVRLVGQRADEMQAVAEWLTDRLRRSVISLELAALIKDPERAARTVRDARLFGSALVISAPEVIDEELGRSLAEAEAALWPAIARFPDLVVLAGDVAAFRRLPHEPSIWRVELEPSIYEARRRRWEEALGLEVPSDEIGRLASTFRFGRQQVDQTIALATTTARLRDPASDRPAFKDILEAGRIMTSPELGRFTVRIDPRYTWDDLVLPIDKHEQLRRLADWVRHRHKVHDEWGFGRKLSRGKGLNVLFTGPSGTGKTMAAEVLAFELGLDLYQIDLSSVTSKYIGETEKNLSAIFRKAEDTQAVLFFDEADALFGKRTEVKDAHDRYANIEVNFLLQRVEQYEGIVILASNLQRNLDDAFLRRLHDVVEFPFPSEPLRERMWRSHVPREAERELDIDYGFLARQFKLTGGSIKNVVLDAAFRAASERRPIAMSDLILATKAELQKQGRLPSKAEFEEWYELIVPQAAAVSRVGS